MMNANKFNKIKQYRINEINEVLGNKAKEYAQEDRLHNFKVAARVNGCTPAQANWGMASKHLVSVIDLVAGRLKPTSYLINEKIGDMINYLILLEALLIEEVEDSDT